MTLKSARSLAHQVFVALTLLLTIYVALVAFGVLKEDVSFTATVATWITLLTSILGLRDSVDRRLEGQTGAWWTAKLCLAFLALVFGAVGGGYCVINMDDIIVASPFFTVTPMIMGALLLAGVVIASWLHWGWILPGIVVLSIVYFFYGQGIGIPLLSHPPYDTGFIMNYLALDPSQGLYLFFHVLTSDLYFLILFGAILVGIGVVRLFMEVGNVVGARVSGGAAFPAIIASGVLGSILAQAVASTTIIGRLTIPTMQRAGYSASMAGAIETLAATSGQLMPPILGLAAFIMAALLNLPYVTVALAAFVPAILYLVALVFSVVSYSGRVKIPKMNVAINWEAIWRLLPSFAIPVGVVTWMLTRYYSPALTGLVGIGLALAVWAFNGKYRVSVREVLAGIVTGLELVVLLAILILLIGPLAQAFQTTGLSSNFGVYLALLVPNSKFLILLIAAVVAMLLGMGLPTPIAYLASVLAMGSFLIQIGNIDALPAHFFLFYFAVFSTITPPVAVGALAASKIANVSYWHVGGQSLKVALGMFILPFLFVYNPELLAFPNITWDLAAVTVLVVLVQWCICCCQFGYMFRRLGVAERVVLFVIGAAGFITLLNPDWSLRAATGAAAVVVSLYMYFSTPASQLAEQPAAE
jgi:TRAP transporter 4TM/12TM fusion protein